MTAGDIANQTGLSKRGIEKQLKKFRDFGIIARTGSDKNGLWVINLKSATIIQYTIKGRFMSR